MCKQWGKSKIKKPLRKPKKIRSGQKKLKFIYLARQNGHRIVYN